MNKRSAQKLLKEFPNLFRREKRKENEPFNSFEGFGFEVGQGWYKIIYDTAKKLEPLIVKEIEKDPQGYEMGYYHTTQIKEKYATLTWYLSSGTDEMYDIIYEAEEASAKVCEQCGKPGKQRGKGWIYTSCADCSKPEDRDNIEYLEMQYKKQNRRKKDESK